ncbi:hypothetical protein [Streptomyces sp. TP-A0356]|uniref:hypothetical protein n=1 Tax=Streptomyces sp. TP-A0356 TaxID=1359208 RepID=UPI000ADE638C|nr:hypothetical protein [Streptomyces sp. TP-A0356]
MIGGLIALAVLVALAVRYVVVAVRLWRHPERASEAARSFSVRGAPGWVITRGIVVVAAHFVLMAIAVIALGTAVTQTQKPAEPWWAISLVAGGGVILCWLLITLIGVFNRPRFLVVPYLRDKRRL